MTTHCVVSLGAVGAICGAAGAHPIHPGCRAARLLRLGERRGPLCGRGRVDAALARPRLDGHVVGYRARRTAALGRHHVQKRRLRLRPRAAPRHATPVERPPPRRAARDPSARGMRRGRARCSSAAATRPASGRGARACSAWTSAVAARSREVLPSRVSASDTCAAESALYIEGVPFV